MLYKPLSVLIMVTLILTGCFSSYEMIDSEANIKHEEALRVLELNQYINIKDAKDLVKNFSSLSWEWIMRYEEHYVDAIFVDYKLLDQAEDSLESMFSLTMNNQRTQWWLNDKGYIIKGEVEGKLVPEKNLDFTFSEFFGIAAYPFLIANQMSLENIMRNQFEDYRGKFLDKDKKSLSAEFLDIYSIQLEIGPPESSSESLLKIELVYTDDFQFMSSWEWDNLISKQTYVEFEILDFLVRN